MNNAAPFLNFRNMTEFQRFCFFESVFFRQQLYVTRSPGREHVELIYPSG